MRPCQETEVQSSAADSPPSWQRAPSHRPPTPPIRPPRPTGSPSTTATTAADSPPAEPPRRPPAPTGSPPSPALSPTARPSPSLHRTPTRTAAARPGLRTANARARSPAPSRSSTAPKQLGLPRRRQQGRGEYGGHGPAAPRGRAPSGPQLLAQHPPLLHHGRGHRLRQRRQQRAQRPLRLHQAVRPAHQPPRRRLQQLQHRSRLLGRTVPHRGRLHDDLRLPDPGPRGLPPPVPPPGHGRRPPQPAGTTQRLPDSPPQWQTLPHPSTTQEQS